MTLKILSSLRARRTLIPNEAPGLMAAQITSKILPIITCEHSLMNAAAPQQPFLKTFVFPETPVLNDLNYPAHVPTLEIHCGLIELVPEQDDSPQSQNS